VAIHRGRSTSTLDGNMTARSVPGPGKMAAETFVAVVLAIAAGVLAEWLSYLELPVTVRGSLALAPLALSVLTFAAFPLLRWPRQGAPIGGIVLFTVIGLLSTVVGSAILMIMVGCHFDECINL
jgi:hypothetical protein